MARDIISETCQFQNPEDRIPYWNARFADGVGRATAGGYPPHAACCVQHGQGNIQSVKRMKDSAEQKINRRERAGGMKMGKKEEDSRQRKMSVVF